MSGTDTIKITEEEGGLWGKIVELPGCFVSGVDMDELLEAAAEAIPMYLSDVPTSAPEDASPDADVVTFPDRRKASRHNYIIPEARILLGA